MIEKRYELTGAEAQELERRFLHHPPNEDQVQRMIEIRWHAKSLGVILHAYCPRSRELSLALTHLEQAQFYANAAIARNEA